MAKLTEKEIADLKAEGKTADDIAAIEFHLTLDEVKTNRKAAADKKAAEDAEAARIAEETEAEAKKKDRRFRLV